MMPYKQQIKSRFDKASATYEDVAYIQKTCAHVLVSHVLRLFPEFVPLSVLDLGSGTGFIPELLWPVFPQAQYTLNDIAPQMLAQSQEKFKNHCTFDFKRGDMEHADFRCYDLITSNLALQWVDHLEQTISKFYKKSKVFAFSCMAEGSFGAWENIFQDHRDLSPFLRYPTENTLTDILSSLGAKRWCIETQDFERVFPDARSVMIYLKKLGASATKHPIPFRELKDLIAQHDHPLKIVYKVLFCFAQRTSCTFL